MTPKIPSDYIAGYEKARLVEPEIADNYIAHTTIGDPDADPVVDLLFSMPAPERARLVEGWMGQDEQIVRDAPELVRNFFEKVDDPPEWFDPSMARAGVRGFHNNLVCFCKPSSPGCWWKVSRPISASPLSSPADCGSRASAG